MANVGLPGSVNDACIFRASILYSDIVRGSALHIKKVLTIQSQREVQLPQLSLIIPGCKNHLLIRYYRKNSPILITV